MTGWMQGKLLVEYMRYWLVFFTFWPAATKQRNLPKRKSCSTLRKAGRLIMSAPVISRFTTMVTGFESKLSAAKRWSWPSESIPTFAAYQHRICLEFNDKYSDADEAQLLPLG